MMEKKTPDQIEKEKISRMNKEQLLELVLDNPEYLCDSYYHDFCFEIYRQYRKLTAC